MAGSPYGTWLRPATGVIVKVFRCGGGLGVKVMKSSVRSRIGKVYMCGAKAAGNGTYRGSVDIMSVQVAYRFDADAP